MSNSLLLKNQWKSPSVVTIQVLIRTLTEQISKEVSPQRARVIRQQASVSGKKFNILEA